jgi:large subunit ribosomal protein L5
MNALQENYKKTIAPQIQTELGLKNTMAVPMVTKIVINMGVKDAVADKKNIERMQSAMGIITGQKPRVARAKKSIATFKLREGDPIGLVVTLRGRRMYEFLERLINVVLPRLKDFRGISDKSFDGVGNYSLGFTEYSVFPEIDLATVERVQGMQINIVTSAQDDKQGYALLKALGMPFVKGEKKA